MAFINGKWRQGLHLEPPAGWLNDPNGLSYFNQHYHVYFQYDPKSAVGAGEKCWGHYRSRDLIHWEFTGTVFRPDILEDRSGVYSGSAIVHEDMLHIFYTGNVKEEGNHDYITSGREANVIHVTTKDGVTMSQKQVVLRNADYPEFCSCHVRDPKIWCENGIWYMVLGARSLENQGCVLFYKSEDLENWTYVDVVRKEDFGYMWECPDCFYIDGHRYLGLSPQGLEHEETCYQNVYASGYFNFDHCLENFKEWDKGFDFYAPQSFETPDGRRVMIGWMGIGDIPYANPTAELGYQHCLTLPREITRDKDGSLLQSPIKELESLRKSPLSLSDGAKKKVSLPFDLIAEVEKDFRIFLDENTKLTWSKGIISLEFHDAKVSGGRRVRKARLEECKDLRIIADYSSLEIYLNGGSVVFSTRMYPDSETISVGAEGIAVIVYPLNTMEVKYLGE